MTSILRSAAVLYSLAGSARQAGSLAGRNKIIFLKKYKGVFNFNELRVRTAAATSTKENIEQDNHLDLENLFFNLRENIKRKNVSRNHFKKALEALDQKGEINSSYLMVLLKCCSEVSYTWSEEERLKTAESVWQIAADFGMQFNINHYNALLEIFVINHHKFSPSEFLNALEKMDVLPNIDTYGLLLKAYCSLGDIEGAKLLLNKMKELDYPLKRNDFNSLIQGYSTIGDLEQAAEVLKIVEEKKIEPFIDSYVHLLCGYAKQGKINMLKEMLNELPNKGIILSDSNLLEIYWTLAVNNYDEHVDMILERISKTENHNKIRYVFRLFDKKKDALALKLLDWVSDKEKVRSCEKEILEFFAAYRNPQEIVDIYNVLQKKEFIGNYLGFLLKIIFSTKNEDFIISFIEAMKAQKMPVKIHYYWPAIIKASKKGNSELFTILKRISSNKLFSDHESLRNVIFANYKLGENWIKDLENFVKIGVKKSILTNILFRKCLEQNKLDEVDYLVNFLVDSSNIKFILKDLFTFIEKYPNDHERIVGILYNIAHNFCDQLVSRKTNMDELKKFNDVDLAEIYSTAVMILLNLPVREEAKQHILEIMLEKKMCIFSGVKSLIKNLSLKPSLGELVDRLIDPNLNFDNRNSILEENRRKRNSTNLLEKAYSKASLDDSVQLMLNLAKKDLFEDAIAVGDRLLLLNKEFKSNSRTKSLYHTFLFNHIRQCKSPNLLDKAFDLGVKLGIYKPNKFDLIVQSYLSMGDASLAVEKFCEYVLRFGELSGCLKLLSKLVSQGNNEAVKRVTNFLSVMYSKNLSMSCLVIALYEAGEEESAKEILKTRKFEFDENILKQACNFWFKKYNCDFLEKALGMFRPLNNFNRQSLYEKIARKYVSDNRIDDLNQLWLQIQEDSDLNEEFVQKMANFVKNPGEGFQRIFKTMPNTLDKTGKSEFLDLLKNGNFDSAINECIQGKVPHRLVINLLDTLAIEGKVSQVLELISTLRLENYIERASSKFLSAEKLDEYFEFVNYFANQGKIARISECFSVGFFQPSLTTSDEHLEKYKSLALRCLEEGNLITPLVSYFVACVKIPGKLAQAEEVVDQYFNNFKSVSHSDLCKIAEATESASAFYENLLSSEKLKSHFFEDLHVFYNKIISEKYNENKLDCVVSLLQKAVADGVKERLDSNLITSLNEKLRETGKSISF